MHETADNGYGKGSQFVDRWFGQVGLTIYTFFPQILNLVGTIGIALSTIYIDTSLGVAELIKSRAGIWLLISIVVFAIGSIWSAIQNTKLASARRKVAALEDALSKAQNEYLQMVSLTLMSLADQLNLQCEGTERLSAYKHDGAQFVIVGRYSVNAVFNAMGRRTYPDNQGVIGQAWRSGEGEAIAHGFPDPNKKLEEYAKRVESDWSVPSSISKNFQMKSRSYTALAIEKPQGDKRRIAILVYESTNSNPLDTAKPRKYKTTEAGRRLVELLENKKALEPSLSFAREKGF